MRKDFFVNEEEKQQRKKHLEEKRNVLSRVESRTSSKSLSNSESLSQTLDEIDRVSFPIPNLLDKAEMKKKVSEELINYFDAVLCFDFR